MRRLATALALLAITFSAAACDPYQVIYDQVPTHNGDQFNEQGPMLPGPHQKPLAGYKGETLPGDPGPSIGAGSNELGPAPSPNTNH